MTVALRAATLPLRRRADAAERMETQDMAEDTAEATAAGNLRRRRAAANRPAGAEGSRRRPGSTGDKASLGGWVAVLPAVVMLLRAGVTDGQISRLTDLRVRIQRGDFAADGAPAHDPQRGSDWRHPANPEAPEMGSSAT